MHNIFIVPAMQNLYITFILRVIPDLSRFLNEMEVFTKKLQKQRGKELGKKIRYTYYPGLLWQQWGY